MRKMATVQTIKNVSPIPNADRLEKVRVLGWNVVAAKGDFTEGNKVIFFEIDSFLPNDREYFEPFSTRGVKTFTINEVEKTGHVLTTVKLRGVVSQGLVLPIAGQILQDIQKTYGDGFELVDGFDVTEALGVVKYEPPLPAGTNIIGPYDTRFAPKTGAVRIQTISEHWDEIVNSQWIPTLKVDGTSQTLMNVDGTIKIFGHNWELDPNSSPGYKIAEERGLVNIVRQYPNIAVQFELAGPGVLGRNILKLEHLEIFVFAVHMNGVKLNRNDWPEGIEQLGTPVLGSEWNLTGDIDEMIEKVSNLRGNITKNVPDEGIVYHYVGEQIPEWLPAHRNIKIISNRFLMKNQE